MGYKNARLSFVLSTLCLVSCLFWAHTAYGARKNERQALWRVDSSGELQAVSAYDQQPSPFPQKKAPVVVKKVVEKVERVVAPTLSPEELKRRQNSQKAAVLLGEIREILNGETSFEADVSQVSVGGRMKGPKGYRIYVNDRWIGVGDAVTVPVIADNNIQQLVDDLSMIDEKLAGVVQEQVKEKLTVLEEYTLLIKDIQQNKVVFEDETSRKHEINF